jgi:hydrogenase nickel incorporation protein HypB
MCDHCGCSDEGTGYTILKPGNDNHYHIHDEHHSHAHPHQHTQPSEQGGHTHAPVRRIAVETDILHRNNLLAQRNRGFFEARKILALNLVSSPGSGKTTLLEQTLKRLSGKPVYVIEGDQQTSLDAERIRAAGIPAVQINTGSGCHLDADMINRAVKELDPVQASLLFIENVGNLVCPALFDLGENYRVVIISVTEGEDKPLKYPNMFQSADICLINKIDLLPYVEFSPEKLKTFARQINPDLAFLEISARTGAGMDRWIGWMEEVMSNEG